MTGTNFSGLGRLGGYRILWALVTCALAAQVQGADRAFDFDTVPVGTVPGGFKAALAGQGKPGDWKIVETIVPSLLPPLSPNAPLPKRRVLSQTNRDVTSERFPLLIFEDEVFGDFTFTTRFNIQGGGADQMGGIVFRYKDEKNFYVLRASALDGNVRFYEVVDGVRGQLIGPKIEISKGVWYELSVNCKGNQIRCLLDGKEIIPPLSNNSFVDGKIGFWTKSDSEVHFVEPKINFIPREPLVKAVVREVLARNTRIQGLKVFARPAGESVPKVVAAMEEKDLGEKGGKTEEDVLAKGGYYFGRGRGVVTVTAPLKDRNGDTAAAVRLTLESFAGQTEQNAIARASQVIKEMEKRFGLARDLYE